MATQYDSDRNLIPPGTAKVYAVTAVGLEREAEETELNLGTIDLAGSKEEVEQRIQLFSNPFTRIAVQKRAESIGVHSIQVLANVPEERIQEYSYLFTKNFRL